MAKTTENNGMRLAKQKVDMAVNNIKPYTFQIKPPNLAPGVVPKGVTAPVLAHDNELYQYANQTFPGGGFPGFPYLAQLATRAEFRSMASTHATEITREWIEITSKKDDDSHADVIKIIEEELTALNVREAIRRAAEMDCYYGRGHLFIDIKNADRSVPLILDRRTIKPNSLIGIRAVEPVWTTPSMYSALDPTAPDFYKPSKWFMLGQEVHASRLTTIITRELPDILKPAFNFAGMSLSQLAEPYVDNWLRTRQSVADLINNFSITTLATSMEQVLQGDDDGADLLTRAQLFTATRSNLGLMLLDKDKEEIGQVNTPLSGLHELQAQSQEHMCSVSRTPAIILTGISPSGLNATSEGEIKTFYDWISATQEAFWREPIKTIIDVIQLSKFGVIDPDIGFTFVPLYQMTPAEEAEIRNKDGQTDVAYIDRGVLDPTEVRERLARDPASGYQGLDITKVIEVPGQADPFGESNDPNDPNQPDEDPFSTDGPDEPKTVAKDAEFKEEDHPRAKNGQFGSGGGGGASKSKKDKHANGGKDSHGFERAPGLNSDEREIEQKFYDAVRKNSPALIETYHKIHGGTIDPDNVKQLNPEFAANPDLARAVREPSSYLAKQIYKEALEDKAARGDTTPVMFTAGGGGSGKGATTARAKKDLGLNDDSLIYDSTLSNMASATARIEQALSMQDGDVAIVYTNTPIGIALGFNAKRSRTVSIDTMLHAHVGASDTIRKLAEHYKDNPRVKISVLNNGQGEPTEGKVEDVPNYQAFNVRQQLLDQAKVMLDSGMLPQNKYDLLIK